MSVLIAHTKTMISFLLYRGQASVNGVQSSTGTQERYEGSLSSLMLVALGMNFSQTDLLCLLSGYTFMLAIATLCVNAICRMQ